MSGLPFFAGSSRPSTLRFCHMGCGLRRKWGAADSGRHEPCKGQHRVDRGNTKEVDPGIPLELSRQIWLVVRSVTGSNLPPARFRISGWDRCAFKAASLVPWRTRFCVHVHARSGLVRMPAASSLDYAHKEIFTWRFLHSRAHVSPSAGKYRPMVDVKQHYTCAGLDGVWAFSKNIGATSWHIMNDARPTVWTACVDDSLPPSW